MRRLFPAAQASEIDGLLITAKMLEKTAHVCCDVTCRCWYTEHKDVEKHLSRVEGSMEVCIKQYVPGSEMNEVVDGLAASPLGHGPEMMPWMKLVASTRDLSDRLAGFGQVLQ
jgi:hypothetical protein